MEEKVLIFSKALRKVIDIYGFEIFNDTKQLSAVLKELLPGYSKEQQKIIETNELQVAQQLLKLRLKLEAEINLLSKRLEDELYFSPKIADIVVKSYSDAIVNNNSLDLSKVKESAFLYDDIESIPRRVAHIFFVIDCSDTMHGSKIGTLNTAIEELIPELRDISETNADAQIKVATLQFATGARWIETAPVPAEIFRWNYLDANGNRDLGAACLELNRKLSRKEFMGEPEGCFAPMIFLMTDGEPTDNYKHGLDLLKKNNWFKKAIKVAIAIGDKANTKVLGEFTGAVESVLTVHSPEALKKWIQFVSVRASEIGSKSSNVETLTGIDKDNNVYSKSVLLDDIW